MARYEYQRLDVGWEDLGPAPADRCCIHGGVGPDPSVLVRGADEDRERFVRRTRDVITKTLNTLGRAGWRVVYYAPAVVRTPATGVTLIADWPGGTHWLARELPEARSGCVADAEREARLRAVANRLRELSAQLAARAG